jgi:surface carbohydrate biosynthesis protein
MYRSPEFFNKKVLVTSFHTGGANAISPVINRLRRENQVKVSVIGAGYAKRVFWKNSISHSIFQYYLVNDASESSMEKILEAESPNLVLTGQSAQDYSHRYVIDQTITIAAKSKNIPVLSVSDFWTNRKPYFSDIYTGEQFRYLPDMITVIDDLQKNIMIGEGFPWERLIITGNPYFDRLADLAKNFMEKEKTRKELGLSLDSFVLLYASQDIDSYYGSDSSDPKYLGYTQKTALHDLIMALDSLIPSHDIEMIVKPHPSENERGLAEMIRGHENYHLIDKNSDSIKAVLASDLIISPFSTVLIEAAYMDKPGISIQPGLLEKDMLITNQLGVTVPIYEKEKILPIITQVMFDANYKKELAEKRKEFGTDGKATERIVNLVYSMVGIL